MSLVFQGDFKSFLEQPFKTLIPRLLKTVVKRCVKLKEGRVGGGGLNKRRYLISFGASSSSYLFFSFLLIVSLTTRKRRESPTTTPQTAPAIMLIFCASVVQKTNVLVSKLSLGSYGQILVHTTTYSTGYKSEQNVLVYLFRRVSIQKLNQFIFRYCF